MPPPAANSNFLSMSSKSAISNQQSDSEVLIRAENVGKIFCRDLKKSLLYGLKDSAKDLIGGSRKDNTSNERQLRSGEFWANKGVSFELRRGECLGLIGHNGAGKTTLLKMLNGLIKPDTGRIVMRGRIGALIALGAGFNPILTGRENIYINGSVLGFSKKDIDEKIDGIIEFAEITEFIDSPVQTYSSGMQVRLGFAVASAMDPDILIIDEVLAVGDLGFRVKCMNRIQELLESTAVIFVSHSMPFVTRICTQAILLKKGRVVLQSASVPKIVGRYHEEFSSGEKKVAGSGEAEVLAAEVIGTATGEIPQVSFGESLKLRFHLRITSPCRFVGMRLAIWNQDQRAVLDILHHDGTSFSWGNDHQELTITCNLPAMHLAPGKHTISVHVFDDKKIREFCRLDNAITFIMGHHLTTGAEVFEMAEWQIEAP
jgi:lipopolysaccharide transport system ATP-binding protein